MSSAPAIRSRQHTYHVIRDHKPTLGGPDHSMPRDSDHAEHVRLVLTSDRRGFAFGVSPRAYSRRFIP